MKFIPFTKYYSDYKFTLMVDTLYVKGESQWFKIHISLPLSGTEQNRAYDAREYTYIHVIFQSSHKMA